MHASVVTISLKVNGNEVRMNEFVRHALAGTVSGFVSALEDIPDQVDRIEIVVEPEKRGKR